MSNTNFEALKAMLADPERKRARIKVACINWSHKDVPHATSYVQVGASAYFIDYHATWDDAMERAGRLARTNRPGGTS